MKTIFISIISGVEAKNILRTNILGALLNQPEVRVVLFLKSEERKTWYEKEYHHERLIYKVVPEFRFSRCDRFFEWLKYYLIRTKTTKLHRQLLNMESGNFLIFWFGELLNIFLSHRLFRNAARLFDEKCVHKEIFSRFFDVHKPQLVFLANLFENAEVSFLREAKSRNIPVLGFINSWDKITSKGMMRFLPQQLLVPTLFTKEEAEYYDDMPTSRITVVGVPQYDTYFYSQGIEERSNFFNKIGLNPAKHLILFGPVGLTFSNSDWQVIDLLHDIITNRFADRAQLLVRFQPNDFLDDEEELKIRPWLKAQVPGVRFGTTRGTDWDMTVEDLLTLKNTLYHTSLLVAHTTSLSVDAACFDKPIINIGFEVDNNLPPGKRVSLRYGTEHYSKALATGGIRLVKSRSELIEWIEKYLGDPSIDREGRRELVRTQCYKFDGKAGERIANFILSHLGVDLSH